MKNYTYFILLFASVFFPILLSFDKKVHFVSQWKAAIIAGILPAILFIIWDIFFVDYGVWKFNADYVIGSFIYNLPVEEVMFFLFIPFACTFIFACLNVYWKRQLPSVWIVFAGVILPVLFIFMAIIFYQKLYTSVVFLSSAITIIILHRISNRRFLSLFYITWLIHLVPLIIINGFLTSLPVLIYNDSENCGMRFGTIPLEDFFYSLTLTAWNYYFFYRIELKALV